MFRKVAIYNYSSKRAGGVQPGVEGQEVADKKGAKSREEGQEEEPGGGLRGRAWGGAHL